MDAFYYIVHEQINFTLHLPVCDLDDGIVWFGKIYGIVKKLSKCILLERDWYRVSKFKLILFSTQACKCNILWEEQYGMLQNIYKLSRTEKSLILSGVDMEMDNDIDYGVNIFMTL